MAAAPIKAVARRRAWIFRARPPAAAVSMLSDAGRCSAATMRIVIASGFRGGSSWPEVNCEDEDG